MTLRGSWKRGGRDDKDLTDKARAAVKAKYEAEKAALLEAQKHEIRVISRDLAKVGEALKERKPYEADVKRQATERVAIDRRIKEEIERQAKIINRVKRHVRGDDGKLAAIEAAGVRRLMMLDADLKSSTERRHRDLIDRNNRFSRELEDAKARHVAEIEAQKKQQEERMELEVARQIKAMRHRGPER